MPPAIALGQFRSGNLFYNRFESVIYDAFPEVKAVRDTMSQEPFAKVLLSGSGAAVYGVARDGEETERLVERLQGRIDADVIGAKTGQAAQEKGRFRLPSR